MKIASLDISFKANKISKRQARYFKERLDKAKDVDIVCHESTDRDSLNCAIAMQRYLDNLGVNSKIILSGKPSKTGIKNPDFRYITANEIKPDDNPVDTALCVDFSAKERLTPALLEYIKKSKNLLCIDHHEGTNLFSTDYVVLKKSIEDADKVLETAAPCYVDSSAKSATSVIYRIFEALDVDIDSEQAYSLMFGLIDDAAKKGYMICDGTEGTIHSTEKLTQDKNAYEVYSSLKRKLDDEQIKKIAMAIDIMSNLNEAEQNFKNSLYEKVLFSDNGKIAYVEIPPDDEEWKSLGGDNTRTSTILNRFRQNILKKYDNVELALTFYEAEGKYRLSAHSKNPDLLNFYNYVEETKIPGFTKNAGGHKDRGGGKIFTTDPETCHKWVSDIISCREFYNQPYDALQN